MKTHSLAHEFRHAKETPKNGENRKNYKGYGHYGRGFVHAAFRLVVHPCCPLEGKHVESRHVESGQYGRNKPRGPEKRMAAVIKRSQDLILAEKPRKKRKAGNRKRRHQKSNSRYGNHPAKPPHLPYVLLSGHGMYNASRTEE